VTLTFAERFRLVFSLSGFANLSAKITTKREWAKTLSNSAQRKWLAKVISESLSEFRWYLAHILLSESY